MPNKFNILTKELESLMKKINQAPQLSQISTKEFKNYYSLISKKEHLQSQISYLSKNKDNIMKIYNTNNEKWLYNDTMNCRKYCKLEKHASYTRDKKLFKLGFLDSKPTHPIINSVKNCINQNIIEPYSEEFCSKVSNIKNKIHSLFNKTPLPKINNFAKITVPSTLTNLAISGAKKCILGYRSLNSSTKFFSHNAASYPVIQILSYIGTQAKKEADLQSNSFLSRIKVDTPYNPTHSCISKTPDIQDDYDIAL